MTLSSIVSQNANDIRKKRTAQTTKKALEDSTKTTLKLIKVITDITKTLDCAELMRNFGIMGSPFLGSQARDELIDAVNECGHSLSEDMLGLAQVDVLKARSDSAQKQLVDDWHKCAKDYVKGLPGYLRTIGAISENPGLAEKLSQDILVVIEGNPSEKAISNLVSYTESARHLSDGFSLTPEVQRFLSKIKGGGAKLSDLTPEIHKWIKEHHLEDKFRIKL